MPGVGAKTARRLFDELGVATLDDLRAAAKGERIRAMKGLGPEGRGEHPGRARAPRRAGRGERPGAALDGPPDRRGAGADAARTPGRRPGRGGGLGAALGRDLQGHRPDRHRRGAAGAGRVPRHQPADRGGRQTGPERRARADPERDLGRPADRRPRGLRQPASALHRLGGAQRGAARGRGRPRPLGLRARDHRGRERRGRALRRRGGRLRAPRLRIHRARAARGPRRAEGGARGQAAAAGHARRRQRRPALPHHPLGRAQHAGGDGRSGSRARLRLHGDHRSLRQPRLRRPRQRGAALGADRRGRRLEQGQTRLPPARRLGGQHRPRRLARLPRGRAGRLDWVIASVHTSFAISERR